MSELLTVPEIAARLRCSEAQVRVLLRSNRIVGGKPAGFWRATDEAVDAYYDSTLNVTQATRRRRSRRSR